MSAYRVQKSKIKSVAAIKAAIADRIVQQKKLRMDKERFEKERDSLLADALALVEKAVEVHDEPAHLIGYQGDVREQKAHVICRRQFVNRHLGGGASNDVGFVRSEDGSFEALVSQYDGNAWWTNAAPRFWQAAQAKQVTTAALANGYRLHQSEQDGMIKLTAEKLSAGHSAGHSAGW